MLESKRLMDYRFALLLGSNEVICGPEVISANTERNDKEWKILFTTQRWLLMGPISVLGYKLLTPEGFVVSEQPLNLAANGGNALQLAVAANVGVAL
jgi:hypothetical protein